MASKQQSRPISGHAVRAFRRRMGMRQSDFARKIGITQALVSHWESGKNAVGADSAQKMIKVFGGQNDQPSLIEFLKDFENQVRGGATLTSNRLVMGITMTVWKWHDQLDLSADPNMLEPAGLITVCLSDAAPTIAIEMPPKERHQRGMIMVFQRGDDRLPTEYGTYLIQQGRAGGASRVLIVETKQGGSKPPRLLPVLPKAASVEPNAIEAVFRLVFEGRYV